MLLQTSEFGALKPSNCINNTPIDYIFYCSMLVKEVYVK